MGLESLHFIRASLPQAQLHLVLPFLITLWMAWTDTRTHRIPNYLTLGCLLSGLGYQLWAHSWTGLLGGLLGVALGFTLLIFFYRQGGLGAGDVKALAALGAWLGPVQTLYLFIYMAVAGVLVIVVFLWRQGLLKDKIRHFWGGLVNWLLLRSYLQASQPEGGAASEEEGIPYALSLALGMAILCGRSFTNSSSSLACLSYFQ